MDKIIVVHKMIAVGIYVVLCDNHAIQLMCPMILTKVTEDDLHGEFDIFCDVCNNTNQQTDACHLYKIGNMEVLI